MLRRKTGLMALREGKEGDLNRSVYAGRTHQNVSDLTGINKQTLSKMLTPKMPFRGTKNLDKLFNLLVPKDTVDKQFWINRAIQLYYIPVEREGPENSARKTPVLICMIVYIKLLHFRDRATGIPPIYRRTVRRPEESYEVDVYDEALLLRTQYYKSPVSKRVITGRVPRGVVDALPIFPPTTELVGHSINRVNLPEVVEFIELTPSDLLQTSFFMFNGFQRNESKAYVGVGSNIFEDCGRIVLVMDMTSFPIAPQYLFTSPPVACHMRANTTDDDILRMSYTESLPGSFIIDSDVASKPSDAPDIWNPAKHTLLQNDRVEFRLSINWDAVNKQQG